MSGKYLNKEKSLSPNLNKLEAFISTKLPKGNIFNIPCITQDLVFKFLTSFDNNKATGIDNKSSKIAKISALVITKQFVITVFVTAVFRRFGVTPLHKRNSTDDPENYRPISILPLLSKVLEKHVHNSLYEFFLVNNLLSPQQSGFRTKHSCETALTEMTDDWILRSSFSRFMQSFRSGRSQYSTWKTKIISTWWTIPFLISILPFW